LNAANEIAVYQFLIGRIQFLDIIKYVYQALEKHSVVFNPNLEDIMAADVWARNFVKEKIDRDEVLSVNF